MSDQDDNDNDKEQEKETTSNPPKFEDYPDV